MLLSLRAVVAASVWLFGAVLASKADQDLVLVHDSTRHLDVGQFAFYKVPVSAAPERTALRIEVESLSGDADVYLSSHEETSRPSFDNYAMKSASFGLEIVEVPSAFPRPLMIGVFADGTQTSAVFRLRVFIDNAKSVDEYERIRAASHAGTWSYEQYVSGSHIPAEEAPSVPEPEEEKAPGSSGRAQGNAAKNPRTAPRVEEKSSWLLTLVFHILEFLVEVLV